ncbi:MAG: hypothetical protein ABSA83_08910 [Verrucomicrobiota bacterium]|jgi:hypothetical protein
MNGVQGLPAATESSRHKAQKGAAVETPIFGGASPNRSEEYFYRDEQEVHSQSFPPFHLRDLRVLCGGILLRLCRAAPFCFLASIPDSCLEIGHSKNALYKAGSRFHTIIRGRSGSDSRTPIKAGLFRQPASPLPANGTQAPLHESLTKQPAFHSPDPTHSDSKRITPNQSDFLTKLRRMNFPPKAPTTKSRHSSFVIDWSFVSLDIRHFPFGEVFWIASRGALRNSTGSAPDWAHLL